MLETLREYAADRLRASGRAVDVQRRHARFYADAFTRWWGPVWWGEDADARLAHIAADYANVQTSLRWLIDHGEAAAAQRLAGSLTFFWLLRGRVEEGRRWLTAALALALSDATPGASAARFGAVVGLGQLAAVGGDRRAALAALEPELPTARERGDAVPLAQALTLAGWLVCWTRHDLASARAYLEEGARVAQTTGSRALEALARRGLASASAMAGDHAEAERLLDVNRALGYDPGQPLFGHTPMLLGALQYGQGRYAAAAAMLEEVSRQYDANRHPGNAMLALTILSWTRLAQGDLDAATTAAVEALTIVHSNLRRNLTPGHLGGPLEALAKVAAAAGDHARALRLEAAGATLRERHAILRSPGEHERLEHSLAPARAALGQRASAAASAAGRSLSVEEAVADALAFKPPGANPTC
jgi:tetratricopeptide (TPR) repeat protein